VTFTFEKEKMTAFSGDGLPAGHILFPSVRKDLVNIQQVFTEPAFRGHGVAGQMMEALLAHLTRQGKRAVLTCPYAQKYVGEDPRWKHILPGSIYVPR